MFAGYGNGKQKQKRVPNKRVQVALRKMGTGQKRI